MKKQFLLYISLLTLAYGGAAAAESVPYSSQLFLTTGMDASWTKATGANRAANWLNDNESSTAQFEVAGVTGGAMKPYDQSYAADAWLISPAITLSAGTEYTVAVWTRTDPRGSSERENFRITVAGEPTVAAQKLGEKILDLPSYVNKGDFERQTGTFTPDTDGEYYFGLNCYSAADQYTMFVTGFSVSADASGPGGETPDPDDPDKPVPVDGKAIPWAFNFDSSQTFSEEWTSVAGPDAAVKSAWTLNTFSGFANYDFSAGLKEDNWLISPALALSSAGAYVIDSRVMAYGTLEIAIGSDPSDPSSFTVLGTFEDTGFPSETDISRVIADIDEPGTYHIAYHACSESGQAMGHRVYSIAVRPDVPVPAAVTDLAAVADAFDALEVNMSWTYPSVDSNGKALDKITVAELFRNGEKIESFENPKPGSFSAYVDRNIPEAGVYTYHIVCHNANGYDLDHAPAEACAGYVGHPTSDFPCNIDIAYGPAAEVDKFTIEDANADGCTWFFDSGSWSKALKSEVPEGTEMNDYVATPYISLAKGYYAVTFRVGTLGMSYRLGYCTDRHAIAQTFVRIAEVVEDSKYTPYEQTYTVAIAEDGEYCFAVHHTGTPANSYYNTLQFTGFSIEEGVQLPGLATALCIDDLSADGTFAAQISWINPATDNAGQPLTSLVKADVYRDGEYIGTAENIEPGKPAAFIDNTVPAAGEYTYSVTVHNENGASEAEAPEAKAYVGPGLELPYSTVTFDDWNCFNPASDWYQWDTDFEGNFGFSQSWGSPDAYALTPYLELEADAHYVIEIAVTGDDGCSFDFVAGRSTAPEALAKLCAVPVSGDQSVHTVYIETALANALDEPSEEPAEVIQLGYGKYVFGFHATSLCDVTVKSFTIARTGTPTGTTTVYATDGELSCVNGTVYCSEAARIAVYDPAGQLLAEADNATELSLSNLAKGRTVIITASTPRFLRTIKVAL